MRGIRTLVLQLLDAFMLLPAMVPDGTSKLGVCLGNTVPQGPDLIIRLVFHEERDQLSAVQSQVTSLIGYAASRSRTRCTHSGSPKTLTNRYFLREVAGATPCRSRPVFIAKSSGLEN